MGKAYIFWRDREDAGSGPIMLSRGLLSLAPEQSDPWLVNPPPFDAKTGRFKTTGRTLTPDQSLELFRTHFPDGFQSPSYLEQERDYKVKASEYAKAHLSCEKISEALASGDVESLVAALCKAATLGDMNLLHQHEVMPVRDALKDEAAARNYFSGLEVLLRVGRPQQAEFSAYLNGFTRLTERKTKAYTWPVATLLPFLIAPEHFMFLKPRPTQDCAANLSRDLGYQSKPNWSTYERLMRFSCELRDGLLAPLAPQDFIDVQSFMWVVAKYGKKK
ncbi:MAG: hypothetical protein ACFHWZ_06895 [Phycisphaerales bacterium]